jgi:hypothetical protein
MTSRRVLIVAVALALAPPTGVAAHHGWSGYDAGRAMTLSGTIKESGYEHPHGFVRLETPQQTWLVVLAPPSRMERRGLAREALAPGMAATVYGYPHRTEADELRAERITVNGKAIELR